VECEDDGNLKRCRAENQEDFGRKGRERHA
jgi:hypothetical protein